MYKNFDSKLKSQIVTIFAGEYYISTGEEVISTVLGSCISVCLYDSIKGIGGMNHFMLPDNNRGGKKLFTKDSILVKEELSNNTMRYGITAMEVLITEMQKNGAHRVNLKAKIFGGGQVLSQTMSTQSIGDKNIGFARAYLKSEGIEIVNENVGRTFGRRIFFLTGNYSVFVKKVAIEPAIEEEKMYMRKLLELKQESDITIF